MVLLVAVALIFVVCLLFRSGMLPTTQNGVCPHQGRCDRPQCPHDHHPSIGQQPTFSGYVGYMDAMQGTISASSSSAAYDPYAPVEEVAPYAAFFAAPSPISQPIPAPQDSSASTATLDSSHSAAQVPAPSVKRKQKPGVREMPMPKVSGKSESSPKKMSSFRECVSIVSSIDSQIEELQRHQAELEAKKLRLKQAIREGRPEEEIEEIRTSMTTPSSQVRKRHRTDEYVPTPIAVLEENKRRRQERKDRDQVVDLSSSSPPPAAAPPKAADKPPTKKMQPPVPEAKRPTAAIVESAKQRVAHTSSTTVPTTSSSLASSRSSLTTLRQKPPSAMVQMMRRQTDRVPQLQPATPKSLQSNDDAGTRAGSIGKGERRTAHVVKTQASSKNDTKPLHPLEPSTSKIPLSIRVKMLGVIHNEYLRHYPAPEAVDKAQQDELTLMRKAISQPAYQMGAANTVRRIRETANTASVSSPSSRVVSHADAMLGRHIGTVTVGAKRNTRETQEMTEDRFYQILSEKHLLTTTELSSNGFPHWQDARKQTVLIEKNQLDKNRVAFAEDHDLSRRCARCGTNFRLDPDGVPVKADCVYHHGRAYKTKTSSGWETLHNCCKQAPSTKGCSIANHHVTDVMYRSELSKFTETPDPTGLGDKRSNKVYALDCEMIYTVRGSELARLSVVNFKDELVLDVVVKPYGAVLDYNTVYSGLTKAHIDAATCDLVEAQRRLFMLVNSETILIGHSLESDLKALRLAHSRVVDTSVVFPHKHGPPYKRALRNLASEVLMKIVQENVDGHDSKEDASTCLQLMLRKVANR